MAGDPPETAQLQEITLLRRGRSAIGGVIASMMALVLFALVAFLVIGTQRESPAGASAVIPTSEAAANSRSAARRPSRHVDE
jgi:hypothetical protein